jgi:hypothetical protein
MPKKELPRRVFVHREEKVMNDGKNYIMRSIFSSSQGVVDKRDMYSAHGVD